MKLNRKGFMMAEVVVVSAIVLIFLSALYISYNQIYGKYQSRVTYYDSPSLYRLAYYRDTLIEDHQFSDVLVDTKTNRITNIYDSDNISESVLGSLGTGGSNIERVYLLYNNKSNLSGNELDNISNIHPTYKDYINYLSTSADFTDSDFVMVMEKCNNDDDCKYAYLEVYDSSESPSSNPPSPSGQTIYRITETRCYIGSYGASSSSGYESLSACENACKGVHGCLQEGVNGTYICYYCPTNNGYGTVIVNQTTCAYAYIKNEVTEGTSCIPDTDNLQYPCDRQHPQNAGFLGRKCEIKE